MRECPNSDQTATEIRGSLQCASRDTHRQWRTVTIRC